MSYLDKKPKGSKIVRLIEKLFEFSKTSSLDPFERAKNINENQYTSNHTERIQGKAQREKNRIQFTQELTEHK